MTTKNQAKSIPEVFTRHELVVKTARDESKLPTAQYKSLPEPTKVKVAHPFKTKLKKECSLKGCEVITITPEQALTILNNFNNYNRKLSKERYQRYANRMLKGQWLDGFPLFPLAFFSDGNVATGQHRLVAQVITGTTADYMCVFNVTDSVRRLMDEESHNDIDKLMMLGYTQTESKAISTSYRFLGAGITDFTKKDSATSFKGDLKRGWTPERKEKVYNDHAISKDVTKDFLLELGGKENKSRFTLGMAYAAYVLVHNALGKDAAITMLDNIHSNVKESATGDQVLNEMLFLYDGMDQDLIDAGKKDSESRYLRACILFSYINNLIKSNGKPTTVIYPKTLSTEFALQTYSKYLEQFAEEEQQVVEEEQLEIPTKH